MKWIMALLLFFGALQTSSLAEDWIDLGEENRTLFLSLELTVPELGTAAELVLATGTQEPRCSVGVNEKGELRCWLYQQEELGPRLKAGETVSLLIRIRSHRTRPDELSVLVGIAGEIPKVPDQETDWTVINRKGKSDANLSRIVIHAVGETSPFGKVRLAPTQKALAESPAFDKQILLRDQPLKTTQALTEDLNPPDPETHPSSALMLDLKSTGTDPAKIRFHNLPLIPAQHGVVSLGDPTWKFRLHNYLAWYQGRYWCFWSHGPVIEDKATQHLRYATSEDGLNWSEVQVLAGPPQEGYGYIARGFWLREGELLALASLYEAPAYHDGDLELVAFRWNEESSAWDSVGRVFDDALNNFAPKQLPSGEWMMSRRASNRDVSLLIGGVKSFDDWQVIPFSTYNLQSGGKPEEPYWWVLPDGKNLVGLFRDNSGSKRLLRSFSTDNGRTWTPPVRTNFPDATSKFNAVQTSRGYFVMISNPNPKARNPLCLSVSRDGLVFTEMVRLPVPGTLQNGKLIENPQGVFNQKETLQYPHVIEQDHHLLVAFSRNKQTVEVLKISLKDVDRLLE